MEFPPELRYTSEHLWVREDGDDVITGVTDFAQDQLGDVVYVEMPDVGETVRAGKPFGLVESAKAVSDLLAPVSGEVVRRNETLDDEPEKVRRHFVLAARVGKQYAHLWPRWFNRTVNRGSSENRHMLLIRPNEAQQPNGGDSYRLEHLKSKK